MVEIFKPDDEFDFSHLDVLPGRPRQDATPPVSTSLYDLDEATYQERMKPVGQTLYRQLIDIALHTPDLLNYTASAYDVPDGIARGFRDIRDGEGDIMIKDKKAANSPIRFVYHWGNEQDRNAVMPGTNNFHYAEEYRINADGTFTCELWKKHIQKGGPIVPAVEFRSYRNHPEQLLWKMGTLFKPSGDPHRRVPSPHDPDMAKISGWNDARPIA